MLFTWHRLSWLDLSSCLTLSAKTAPNPSVRVSIDLGYLTFHCVCVNPFTDMAVFVGAPAHTYTTSTTIWKLFYLEHIPCFYMCHQGESSKKRWRRMPGYENLRFPLNSELSCLVNKCVLPFLRSLVLESTNSYFIWIAMEVEFHQTTNFEDTCTRLDG